MTDSERHMTLQDFAAQAEQEAGTFEADDGLTLEVRSHVTQSGTGGYLEIVGRAKPASGEQAFAYRAAQGDLEAHGDAWFIRKALRSLNDMYRAGHLPAAQEKVDHQTLKPGGEYTDEPYRS